MYDPFLLDLRRAIILLRGVGGCPCAGGGTRCAHGPQCQGRWFQSDSAVVYGSCGQRQGDHWLLDLGLQWWRDLGPTLNEPSK